jgi:hypothetical protein
MCQYPLRGTCMMPHGARERRGKAEREKPSTHIPSHIQTTQREFGLDSGDDLVGYIHIQHVSTSAPHPTDSVRTCNASKQIHQPMQMPCQCKCHSVRDANLQIYNPTHPSTRRNAFKTKPKKRRGNHVLPCHCPFICLRDSYAEYAYVHMTPRHNTLYDIVWQKEREDVANAPRQRHSAPRCQDPRRSRCCCSSAPRTRRLSSGRGDCAR